MSARVTRRSGSVKWKLDVATYNARRVLSRGLTSQKSVKGLSKDRIHVRIKIRRKPRWIQIGEKIKEVPTLVDLYTWTVRSMLSPPSFQPNNDSHVPLLFLKIGLWISQSFLLLRFSSALLRNCVE